MQPPCVGVVGDSVRRRGSGRGSTWVAAWVLLFLGASCASYPERTEGALRAFRSGDLERAATLYANEETTGSRFLSGAEAGMAAFSAGDWGSARRYFERAAAESRGLEDRGLLAPDRLGESLLRNAVAEGWTAYRGEGFERVMLHSMMALCFLAEGRLEDVAVEARRSNQLLESEEELYEKEYAAGGLGHFLSALSYELRGDLDEAYIDYERMVQKGVGLEVAGPALVRISKALHRTDDLERWESRFGSAVDVPEGSAHVVFVGGLGLGPTKRAITIDVPTQDGLLQWSVPQLLSRNQGIRDFLVEVDGGARAVRAVTVEDVDHVSQENLEDRIGWLAGRSALRAFLKRGLTRHLEDKFDGWGRLAGDLFTFVTERADLRAWQTLPRLWQAQRLTVSAGVHEYAVVADGGSRRYLGRFELEPGETLFILARSVDHAIHAHVVGGLPIGGPDLEPQPAP